jgi:hypothetical protein
MNCGFHHTQDSAKKAEVTLRLEGQPQVKWVRTSSGVQYHLSNEDKPNEKCGKNDLWDFLPQYPIQQEPDGKIFNFHTEFDILFPFGHSSQELFKIFERVVSLDDTASVLKSMNDELTFLTAQRDREYTLAKNVRALVEETKTATCSIAAATRAFSKTETVQTAELLLQEEVQRFRFMFENVSKLQDLFSSLTPLNDDLSSWFPSLKIIYSNDQGDNRIGGVGERGFFPENRSETAPAAATTLNAKQSKANRTHARITATNDANKRHDISTIKTANTLAQFSAEVDTRLGTAGGAFKALRDHRILSLRHSALSGLPECPTLDMRPLERVQSLCGALECFRGLESRFEALEGLPEALGPAGMATVPQERIPDLLGPRNALASCRRFWKTLVKLRNTLQVLAGLGRIRIIDSISVPHGDDLTDCYHAVPSFELCDAR